MRTRGQERGREEGKKRSTGARELQLMDPFEQVIIGMGSSSTGMHQPGDVAFHTEPHLDPEKKKVSLRDAGRF